MRGIFIVAALSVCAIVAPSDATGCFRINMVENLVVSPRLAFYVLHYPSGQKISLSCENDYYLYDAQESEYVKGNKFEAVCRAGEFYPSIPDKRFRCQKPDPVCTLKKTPKLIAKPDKSTFKRGEEVQFDCEKGYYLIGVDETVCLKGGDFLDEIPTCAPYCVEPKQKYLIVDSNRKSFKRGGSISLDCEDGYRLRGGVDETRYCQRDGQWDSEIEDNLCERIGCPYAPKLPNGEYYPSSPSDEPGPDGWYMVGARLEYKCNDNYYLKGKDWMLCARTGKFIYRLPECIEIRCTEVMDIDNGSYEPERDSYAVGRYVDYTCIPNYKLSTTSGRRFCRLNSDKKTASFEKPPRCERIECDMPKGIDKGDFSPSKGPYFVGDTVDYKCDDGYYLFGNKEAACLLNKDRVSASFTDPPACKPILCDRPMAPKKGDFGPKNDKYSLGQTVTFKCEENYYLDGPITATCVEDTRTKGKFTEIPVCEEILCDKPMTIDKGGFEPDEEQYSIGESVDYFCVKNYKLVPSDGERTCELNKDGISASFPKPPACERIQCSKPKSIKYGQFSPVRKAYYVGDAVDYICDPGYYLSGKERNECELNEDMVSADFQSPPSCLPIICDKPMSLLNGRISKGGKDSYTVGDKVEYECDFKYYLDGEDTATCKQTGVKTGEFTKAPVCEEILCDDPMSIDKGDFGPKRESYTIGSEVTYKCIENYKLVGVAKSICRKTGRMTAEFTDAPHCQIILCDDPMTIKNGDFVTKPDPPFTVGEVVTYFCDRGYEFATNFRTSTCTLESDGESAKFSKPPACKRVYCSFPGEPDKGSTSPAKKQYVVDESVTFSCDKCYRLVGKSKATCQQDGKFDYPLPECKIITCSKKHIPYPEDAIFYPTRDVYKCGDEVFFKCHDAFNLINDKSSVCTNSGKWTVENKAVCDPIYCYVPKLNKNVRVTLRRTRYVYNTTIEYYCRPGYSVVEEEDKTKAVCQRNGQFSNPSINCKLNECPSPPVPEYGEITEDSQKSEYYPGDEIEYECNVWYTLEEGADGFNECQNDGTWKRPAPKCLPPSCKGQCFSKVQKGRPCQCDYECDSHKRKDCCPDRKKQCSRYSCYQRCGQPVAGGCSCDRGCTTSYTRRCCRDYLQACPGLWYLAGR